MSDFSFDELKRLIKEQLGERFPAQLHEVEIPTPPEAPKGLLELRKIAALQRTFSPAEKASALSKFAGRQNNDPWAVLNTLRINIEQHSKGALTAKCPEDLIQNVVTLASFADLLFSGRTAQAKGWFMEEWVAEATGGEVIPAGTGLPIHGTADVKTGNGDLWSVKLTVDTKIKGSRRDFLHGMGYASFVSSEDKGYTYFLKRTDTEGGLKPVNYLFFKKGADSEMEIIKIDGESIYKTIEKNLSRARIRRPLPEGATLSSSNKKFMELKEAGALDSRDVRIFADKSLKKDLGSVKQYKGEKNSMKINFKLEENIQFANDGAQAMFENFNAIAQSFEELITTMTAFYGEPNDAGKKAASVATQKVDGAVNTFQTACIPTGPEETT
jgi:hypothetical protein